jgi:hypothetical protein
MDWIVRNLSLLAFLLVLVVLAGVALKVITVLSNVGRLGVSLVVGELLSVAILLVMTAVAYGLLVRFLALCDDIAAVRKVQTGTPSSLD